MKKVSIKSIVAMAGIAGCFIMAGVIEARGDNCNPVTYYGCSPEYKIAAQQQQFNHRQYSQRMALDQLGHNKAVRAYSKALERARQAETSRKLRAKNSAVARHENARKTRGKTSYLTQTSDGTWIQTEVNRGKRRNY